MSPTAEHRLLAIETTLTEILKALKGDELGNKGIVSRVEVLERLAERQPCPNPGSCLSLAKDVEVLRKQAIDHETAIRKFESVLDQARGFGAAGRLLWAFIGAGGFGVAFAIYSLVAK